MGRHFVGHIRQIHLTVFCAIIQNMGLFDIFKKKKKKDKDLVLTKKEARELLRNVSAASDKNSSWKPGSSWDAKSPSEK